jgi:chromosome segregation ATPase
MNTAISRVRAPVLGAIMGAAALSLAGCSGVSDLTKEHVARSETAVNQAQQTLGNSEAGALELQRAKQNLDQARAALNKNDAKNADAFAQQAQLDAELAIAKSQTAAARKAADEVMASIQTLRQEAQRPQPRTP